MSRFALAVLLALGASARRASAASPDLFPSEKQARASARARVAGHCAAFPAECAAVQGARAGYEQALDGAAACRETPCGFDRLVELSNGVEKLDASAGRLTPDPRNGRPLDALSVLASARLSALAGELEARDGKTHRLARADPSSLQIEELTRSVETECGKGSELCAPLRARSPDAISLANGAAECARAPCPFDAVDALVLRGARSLAEDKALAAQAPALGALQNGAYQASLKLLSQDVSRRLHDLSSDADKLSKNLDRLEKGAADDPQDLRRDSDSLFTQYREVSVGEDRLVFYLGYDTRAHVNAMAGRLAGLRSRALAVMAARGMSLPPAAGEAAAPSARPSALAARGRGAGAAAPTLLDARAVPPPAGSAAVYGNPELYMAQAFRQSRSDDCGVAIQVQVLRAHGLLPANVPPRVQEEQMIALARKRGYWTDGIPASYAGELLIDSGLLVSKTTSGSWEDLEAALRRGHAVIATVDARYIWRQEGGKAPLPHTILVTGLKADSKSGKPLGVFINDSGSRPPDTARFVPFDAIRAALMRTSVEIL